MTDPQRRAVEAIDSWFKSSYKNLGYGNEILARVSSANLVILDRETVESAIAVAKAFTPRWTEYECFTQMQEALGDV